MSARLYDIGGPAGVSHPARLYAADSHTARGALLVLAHGAGAGQSHPFMMRYAQGLADRGIDVITFDFPYIQAGRRTPDRAPVLEETFRRVVISAAAVPDLQFRKLFIGGKSMGGRMATHLAAAPDLWVDQARPLAGVVVFGYPLNPPGTSPERAKGVEGSRRSPDRISHFARITVPLLIVQGTRDTFGGPHALRAAIPQATVFDVVGADHSPKDKFDHDIWDRVVAFVSSTYG